MKKHGLILSTCIAAMLVGWPAMAQMATLSGPDLNTTESARITQTVNSSMVSTLPRTHLRFVSQKVPVRALADATPMNHLQLMLQRSVARQTSLDSLIADQHNPQSSRFHQWLTPRQFGEQFGVVDSDIVAVKAWLESQGFTVNSVYPNKMQIDFSGTAGLVKHAFGAQESLYAMSDGSMHRANAGDISIPIALRAVVAGVAGLNDFHPSALNRQSKPRQWNASKANIISSTASTHGQAVVFQNPITGGPGARGLVPNDLVVMYGIAPLRSNGVTGKGIAIAVVSDHDMWPEDWGDFLNTFNLGRFTESPAQFGQFQPTGPSSCEDPDPDNNTDDSSTLLQAEWASAIAPGAFLWVATCSDSDSSNSFGGVFAAATNLINGDVRPNIITAGYALGEFFTDSASKMAIDLMWAQADAEGISVFVATGDSGSNPSFSNGIINGSEGAAGVDANALATSPNVTAVGGTDTADVLDGTTSTYFGNQNSVYGTALSYVPEIPWNQSCGNGVAATSAGFSSVLEFCSDETIGGTYQSEASSGGPSSIDRKPTWQRQVFNAAKDQSRDLPDVAMFAGSYGDNTFVMTCTETYPCFEGFNINQLSKGTSVSTAMFAGIQALIDQGLAARGLSANQGNAAPTLYALAANEYGIADAPNSANLATCNANNGATGTAACVFHNVTRGSISSNCYEIAGEFTTANCFYYTGYYDNGNVSMGLTTSDASPTTYGVPNKAYGAQPGWSFASGLGSVNVTNLLIAWRAFVHAPAAPASPSSASQPAAAIMLN